ncbi:MAG: NAD(+) diphosphatase [Pseudomonadota bacterium]
MTTDGNFFSGAYLDRRSEERSAAGWLAQARADSGTLYMAMQGTMALMQQPGTGEPTEVAFLSADHPLVQGANAESQVLLGWFRQQRCVLVELPKGIETSEPARQFAELRPLACNLPPEEAGLLAYARALAIWRSNNSHCGRCGAPTVTTRAGHARECTRCGHETFPRIDPAIIVLVRSGERALLGRQPSWPPRRYSTIAGFVEPGESLEDAVRREIFEETGVSTTQVSYHSSQPWPFPSSLMLGFLAEGIETEPHTRDGELEDARWFSREELTSGEILLPPRESISRRLVDHWLVGPE